jgi:hypothetical protein
MTWDEDALWAGPLRFVRTFLALWPRLASSAVACPVGVCRAGERVEAASDQERPSWRERPSSSAEY